MSGKFPGLERLNHLPEEEARAALTRCCGSRTWVEAMLHARPFPSMEALYTTAGRVWRGVGREDVLEAISHHPRIGDVDALRKKYAAPGAWEKGEQAGIQGVSEEILQRLAQGNRAYEERFGYIFLVCATGKSAEQMLALLEARLENPPEQELVIARGEQEKITHLRLEKLLA